MIRFLLKNSRWMLGLSVLTGLCSGLGGAGLIAVINEALDPSHPLPPALGWIFLGLCALLLLARFLSSVLLMRLGQNVIFNLRMRLTRMILAAPFRRLQALGAARILACMTEDVTVLAEASRWLPVLCINLAIVSGCLVYLGWLSPALLALVSVTIVLGIGGFRAIENRAIRRLSMARECDDTLFGHIRSLTQGIKELKLHHGRRDAFLSECLEPTANRYRRHYVSSMNLFILASNWSTGLFYAAIGLALFAVSPLRAFGMEAFERLGVSNLSWLLQEEITPQTLRGYCLTILYMMFPLTVFVDGLPFLGRATIALNKIQALVGESAVDLMSPPPPRTGESQPQRLELAGITHSYFRESEDHWFTLGPIDLTINPGDLIFLVGGNGSGKTTLALLLVGLYSPDQGGIYLGGQGIDEHHREAYRQNFSAVFSDFYLFDSLLGFRQGELDSEARAYLARLQLDHKVTIENGAFSSLELSQGQRKRLALLVAYLEDRPFYVFDEWAADQDPVFKRIFYTEILPSLKARGKTVVVITHDDAYFNLADRCLLLEHGKIKGELRPDSNRNGGF